MKNFFSHFVTLKPQATMSFIGIYLIHNTNVNIFSNKNLKRVVGTCMHPPLLPLNKTNQNQPTGFELYKCTSTICQSTKTGLSTKTETSTTLQLNPPTV